MHVAVEACIPETAGECPSQVPPLWAVLPKAWLFPQLPSPPGKTWF